MNVPRAGHASASNSTGVQVVYAQAEDEARDIGDYYRGLAQDMSMSYPNDNNPSLPTPGPSRLPDAPPMHTHAPYLSPPLQNAYPYPPPPPSPPLPTPSRDDRAELARAAALARRISARRADDAGYSYPGPPPAAPAESGPSQLRRPVGSRWGFLPGANVAGAHVWDHEAGVVVGAGVGLSNESSPQRASLPVTPIMSVDARSGTGRRYSEAVREYPPSGWYSHRPEQGNQSQAAVQNFGPRDPQRHPDADTAATAQAHWLGRRHTPHDNDYGSGMRICPAAPAPSRGAHGAPSSHTPQFFSSPSPYRHKPAWGHRPLWRVAESSANVNSPATHPKRPDSLNSAPNIPQAAPDAHLLTDRDVNGRATIGLVHDRATVSLLRDAKDAHADAGVPASEHSPSGSPHLSVVTALSLADSSSTDPVPSRPERHVPRVPTTAVRMSLLDLDEPAKDAGVLYGGDGLCTESERRTLYEFERLMLLRGLVGVFALRSFRKRIRSEDLDGDGDLDTEYCWRWRCTLSVVEPYPSKKWVLPGAQVVRGTRCEAKAAAAAKALAALEAQARDHGLLSTTTTSCAPAPIPALHSATSLRRATRSESDLADMQVDEVLYDDYDAVPVAKAAPPIIRVLDSHESEMEPQSGSVDFDMGSIGVHTPSHGSLTPFEHNASDLDLDLLGFGSAWFPERSASANGERLRWIGEARPVSPFLDTVTVVRAASR